MTRILICGCPRAYEGKHDSFRLVLPIRADAFIKWLPSSRCRHRIRPRTDDDDGLCGQAIMVLGIEEAPQSGVSGTEPRSLEPTGLSEVHPSDCQSCSEGSDPCQTHTHDWRYWQARALDAEKTP